MVDIAFNEGPGALRATSVRAVVALCLLGLPEAAFGQGLAREPEDRYQAYPVQPRFRSFLPPKVDLAERFPTPGNQGPQGSCTAWAVGYSLRGYYTKLNGTPATISPSFIYNQINPQQGNCRTPTFISDALDFVQLVGAVPMASFPYDPDDCLRQPSRDVTNSARPLRIETWRRVDTATLDDMKGELAHGHPVVFGMTISKQFESLKPDEVYAPPAGPGDFGHAMVVAGYDEERQAFKVANSWGTQWADGGFGWVSYDAFLAHVDRAFVMRTGAPAPSPLVAEIARPIANVVAPPSPVAPPAPAQVILAPPPPPITPPAPVEVVVAPPPPPIAPPAPVQVVLAPPPPIIAPPAPVQAIVAPPSPPAPAVLPPAIVVAPRNDPPARRPDASALQARLAQLIAPLGCTRVRHRVVEGAIELAGFIASEDSKSELRRAVTQFDPQARLSDEALLVRPWPQCEALSTFERAFEQPEGLRTSLSASTLREGERLVVEIKTPNFPAYVYVTYLQAGGDAVHLYQPRGRLPRALPAGSTLRIGEAPGPVFRIGAPFGAEMIVVLAAASPLFEHERPLTQIEREYLTEFRAALTYRPANAPRGPERRVAATAAWLTTMPAPR